MITLAKIVNSVEITAQVAEEDHAWRYNTPDGQSMEDVEVVIAKKGRSLPEGMGSLGS